MKALLIDNSTSTPVMKPGEADIPKAKPGELLVKIEATALNRADLLQKAGKYPVPEGASPILGLEMAGVVEEAGKGCKHYNEGDRVMALLNGGGYAEYCSVPENRVMPVPETLSFEEAAAMPEVFLTAYQGLSWIGELYDNETVLVHAGASGVGTAAIQIAKQAFNATIVVTAGSESKLDLCRSLGADFGINYKTDDFETEIEKTYGPSAVDVILDFVGAPYWHQNISVLSTDGRLVHLGLLGGTKVDQLNIGAILRKRLTIRGSTLRSRSDDYKALLTSEFMDQIYGYFEVAKMSPVIDSVYSWEDVEQAHQRMKQNKNAGKIVLTGM